jgi:hypothetical protein
MWLLLLALLPAMVGCQAIRDYVTEKVEDEVVAYADGPLKDKVEGYVETKVGEDFPAWKAEADVDQSGDTTWDEWKAFLFSGSGGLALLGWVLKKLRDQKIETAAVASKDSRKRGEIWTAVKNLEGKVNSQPSA